MPYSWEQKSLEKYGEETTARLIKNQQEYEKENEDNDCQHCGKGNEGSVVEWPDGRPFIMHYGLWTNDQCNFCKRPM